MAYLYVCLVPVIALIFSFFLRIVIEYHKGRRFPKGRSRVSSPSFIKRIYWDFPKAFINDRLNRDVDFFPEYGLHLICGEQGSGKTVTLAYLLRKFQRDYPELRVRTNFFYVHEDASLSGWQDLVFSNNGIKGQIDVLDEIQNWFNSMQSKDFPPEMLQEITQQRKQRKMIFGTAQVFTRVAKPIREQVNLLYLPLTLFGCLTVVRVYKPSISDDGTLKKAKLRRMFFFVHDAELRDSFDTYRKISMMARDGFAPRQWAQTVVLENSSEKG